MPNQRSTDKRFVGAYLPCALIDRFTTVSLELGLSLTQALQLFVEEGVDKHSAPRPQASPSRPRRTAPKAPPRAKA
ncbi:MAG: hypothetical protein ACYDC1_25460 [Limisphaerales bacterium]